MSYLTPAEAALFAVYIFSGLLFLSGLLVFRGRVTEPMGKVDVSYFNWADVGGVGFVWCFFGLLALGPLFLASAPPAADDQVPQLTVGAILGSSVLMGTVSVLPMALIARRTSLVSAFGLKDWRSMLVAVPVGFVAIYAVIAVISVSGILTALQQYFGELEIQAPVKMISETDDRFVLGALVVSAVILAPLIEEIIFRGYVFSATKRLTNTVFAVVFSGLFFSLVHGNVLASLPLFAVGAILAIAYEKTGSLWVPIAIHALFNGTQVALILVMKSLGVTELPSP